MIARVPERLRPPVRIEARRAIGAVRSLTARVNPAPVIVLGNEKSGTTAVAALLARHAGLSVTLDVPAFFGRGVEPLLSGRLTFDEALRRTRHAFSREIVKEPTLTWIYPQVRKALPGATFLLIVRDPRANIRSIFNRMGIAGDLERLDSVRRSVPPRWRWHFQRPELLGLEGRGYVELAAARWNRAADTYLDHRSEIRLVRYEDFVADKAGFLWQLATELDLPHRRDVSAEVDEQFQGRGNRSVSWERFFGERNLRTIEDVCAARMAAFGYAPSANG